MCDMKVRYPVWSNWVIILNSNNMYSRERDIHASNYVAQLASSRQGEHIGWRGRTIRAISAGRATPQSLNAATTLRLLFADMIFERQSADSRRLLKWR